MLTVIFKSCCSVKSCEYKMLSILIAFINIDLFAPSILLPLCIGKLKHDFKIQELALILFYY